MTEKEALFARNEPAKREKIFLNVYGRNFWRFQPESNRLSGFGEPYISATIRVIILKQEPKDAHFFDLQLIKLFHAIDQT